MIINSFRIRETHANLEMCFPKSFTMPRQPSANAPAVREIIFHGILKFIIATDFLILMTK